jgi:histidinol-phosphate aminotransferase
MQPRDLSSHSPYVPGRGAEEVARELGMDADDLTKLSSNENPHGPSPDAVDALREYSTRVHVYPTTAHTDLTAALAERWALDPEQVWVSAGADGALDYLARAMLSPDDRVLVPEPGFSYYPMSARYHHGTVATYQLSKAADFEQSADTVLASYDGERIVYLTTPHNPTGAEFAREDVVELAESVDRETLVVVDEAYAEFSDRPSSIDLLDDHENLAVTRTFSKAYGLAGLRIGWAAVPTAWARPSPPTNSRSGRRWPHSTTTTTSTGASRRPVARGRTSTTTWPHGPGRAAATSSSQRLATLRPSPMRPSAAASSSGTVPASGSQSASASPVGPTRRPAAP